MTYFRCMTVYHLLWSIPTTSSNTINQECLSIKNTIHFFKWGFLYFPKYDYPIFRWDFSLFFFVIMKEGFFFRDKTKVKL